MNIFKWGFYDWVNNGVYFAQFVTAVYGVYCVVLCFLRVAQKRFRNEAQQDQFLETLGESMAERNYDAAIEHCSGDQRAVCQLGELALLNRHLGYGKVRALVLDRFQRDVLADLEHRMSWINTVVKTAPMLGLLGTVLGMMQAFAKLAGSENVKPDQLAADISFALITTAIGLSVAIPLIVCMSSINVRIRQMEDLVGAGLTRFFDLFKATVDPSTPPPPPNR